MVSIAGLARIVDPAARSQARSDRSRALICDRRFAHRLNELHNIKNFLYEEKVKFDSDKIAEVDLGVLNQLYYGGGGRLPSAGEWALLDEKLCVLVSYLDDNLRRKLRIRELGLFFWSIPLAFLIFAILSTGFALCFLSLLDAHTAAYTISFVLTLFAWTISQGGLGACAFLGTSVIARSVEENQTRQGGPPLCHTHGDFGNNRSKFPQESHFTWGSVWFSYRSSVLLLWIEEYFRCAVFGRKTAKFRSTGLCTDTVYGRLQHKPGTGAAQSHVLCDTDVFRAADAKLAGGCARRRHKAAKRVKSSFRSTCRAGRARAYAARKRPSSRSSANSR